jgi:hypothetical protein
MTDLSRAAARCELLDPTALTQGGIKGGTSGGWVSMHGAAGAKRCARSCPPTGRSRLRRLPAAAPDHRHEQVRFGGLIADRRRYASACWPAQPAPS